jgi:hypothetical protein
LRSCRKYRTLIYTAKRHTHKTDAEYKRVNKQILDRNFELTVCEMFSSCRASKKEITCSINSG